MTSPAKNVITKCGGPDAVAKMCGVHVTRVYRWTYPREKGGTGGFVPTRHQNEILEAARQQGIDLAPADFFATPEPEDGDVEKPEPVAS